MTQDSRIGLTDLINQVKQDLLASESGDNGEIPLFSIDAVTLELQVTVTKEAHGGLQIWVIALGGQAGRDDAQTVTVTLSPLLDKEERIRLYKERHPERWRKVEDASLDALTKGDSQPVTNVYGAR